MTSCEQGLEPYSKIPVSEPEPFVENTRTANLTVLEVQGFNIKFNYFLLNYQLSYRTSLFGFVLFSTNNPKLCYDEKKFKKSVGGRDIFSIFRRVVDSNNRMV